MRNAVLMPSVLFEFCVLCVCGVVFASSAGIDEDFSQVSVCAIRCGL